MKKFARKCDGTGEGMNDGYVLFDGELHFKYEENVKRFLEMQGYGTIDEAYEEDILYWTEWEDEDDFEWIEDENGNLIEL